MSHFATGSFDAAAVAGPCPCCGKSRAVNAYGPARLCYACATRYHRDFGPEADGAPARRVKCGHCGGGVDAAPDWPGGCPQPCQRERVTAVWLCRECGCASCYFCTLQRHQAALRGAPLPPVSPPPPSPLPWMAATTPHGGAPATVPRNRGLARADDGPLLDCVCCGGRVLVRPPPPPGAAVRCSRCERAFGASMESLLPPTASPTPAGRGGPAPLRSLPPPSEVSSITDAQCGVCFARPKTVAFVPCGHQCCAACVGGLSGKCHLCRAAIHSARPVGQA